MTVPFALSVHSFVNSVGAYVGLGSIVAVAILILLYFAHARETATLRERLDEAQQRIGGLEGRIGQLTQSSQRARVQPPVAAPGQVTPVPAPPGLRPVGGSVRRIPSPATAAATMTPAAGAAPSAAQPRGATLSPSAPSAPAGTGAPALASATKLIPDAATPGAPDDTIFVPAAAASNGGSAAEHTAVLAAPVQAAPASASASPAPAPTAPVPAAPVPVAPAPATAAAATAAAAAAPAASASPRGAVATPPRVQIGAERESTDNLPATSAGGGGIRRIGGHPQSPVSLPPFDEEPAKGRRFAGQVLPLLIGVVAIAVIVAGLIVLINAGGGSTTGNVNHNGNSGQTGQNLHNRHTTPPPFRPAKVTVAVLNGTAQSGLAGDVGKKLGHEGYTQGNITNAASQTQSHTFVYYVARGRATKANRTAAQHVARALKLSLFWVRRANPPALQSCAISAAGTSLGSCKANVIVSVGQNRVNLASGG
jgi:hypothetical protein